MLAIATNIHVLLIVRDLEGGPNCRVSELLRIYYKTEIQEGSEVCI